MTTLLTVLHVIVCLFLMLTVLLQSGKSGGMGAAFGGGNAATVFGGSGASSFLRRLTAGAVTVFMVDSMVLAYLATRDSGDSLTKWGKQQEVLAKQKEDAVESAAKASKGSNAGSNGSAGSAGAAAMTGSAGAATVDGSAVTGSADEMPSVAPGSAAAPATK